MWGIADIGYVVLLGKRYDPCVHITLTHHTTTLSADGIMLTVE
jgi:hypothetical protein